MIKLCCVPPALELDLSLLNCFQHGFLFVGWHVQCSASCFLFVLHALFVGERGSLPPGLQAGVRCRGQAAFVNVEEKDRQRRKKTKRKSIGSETLPLSLKEKRAHSKAVCPPNINE
eukprot:1162020-Pelagomonas_calceolata.AAC.12